MVIALVFTFVRPYPCSQSRELVPFLPTSSPSHPTRRNLPQFFLHSYIIFLIFFSHSYITLYFPHFFLIPTLLSSCTCVHLQETASFVLSCNVATHVLSHVSNHILSRESIIRENSYQPLSPHSVAANSFHAFPRTSTRAFPHYHLPPHAHPRACPPTCLPTCNSEPPNPRPPHVATAGTAFQLTCGPRAWWHMSWPATNPLFKRSTLRG